MTALRRWVQRSRANMSSWQTCVMVHVRHHAHLARDRITAKAGHHRRDDSWSTSTWTRARVMTFSRHPHTPGTVVVGLSLRDGVTVVANRRGVSSSSLADVVIVRTVVIDEIPLEARNTLASLADSRERITFRREWGSAISSGLETWTEHIECADPIWQILTLVTDQRVGAGLSHELPVNP
jgi:hypothetical protein